MLIENEKLDPKAKLLDIQAKSIGNTLITGRPQKEMPRPMTMHKSIQTALDKTAF